MNYIFGVAYTIAVLIWLLIEMLFLKNSDLQDKYPPAFMYSVLEMVFIEEKYALSKFYLPIVSSFWDS